MKKLRTKGLLFEGIDELFENALTSIISESETPLEELIEKLQKNFKKITETFSDSVSTTYLQLNKFNLNEFVTNANINRSIIAAANEKSFYYFRIYLNACFSIYDKGVEVMQRKRLPSVIKIGMSVYGLILRRADQIATMLLDGYIDGAMII